MAAVITVAVAGWTVRQPKVYEASCTVEYDPSATQVLGGEIQDVAAPNAQFWSAQEFYETQNRIIASRAVAEQVVRDHQLHLDPVFNEIPESDHESWAGVTEATAARRLQDALSVEPVRDTRLVKLVLRSEDPGRAASLVNAVVHAYLQKTLEDRTASTERARAWLHEQLNNLDQGLEKSELALHQFKRENSILSVSLEDRQNIVANEIQSLNQSLAEARAKRIGLVARLSQIQAAFNDDPENASASSLLLSPNIEELRRRVREKRTESAALEARYGEAHPNMRAVTQELNELVRQLRAETRSHVDAAKRDVREARAVEAGLSSALDQSHTAGLEINRREIEYRQLHREQQNKAKIYEVLLERTAETDLTRMLEVTHARVVDPALVPKEPVAPKVLLNIAGGLGLGLLLGLALAWMLSMLDARVKTVEDVEELGMTVLGALPLLPGTVGKKGRRGPPPSPADDLIVHTRPRSRTAEACRALRTNLAFLASDKPMQTLVVTSPGPEEGKTSVSVSLATTFAQGGKRVLLIDSDLRRPRVHKVFDLQRFKGLTSILVDSGSFSEAIQQTKVPNLDVMASGPVPPNPAELLQSAAFLKSLTALQKEYDIVICDSPPLGPVTDGAILGAQCDGVVMVCRARRTHRRALAASARQLRDAGGNLLGVVLNGAQNESGNYGYGGTYRYYYSGTEAEEFDAPLSPGEQDERPTHNA